MIEYSMDLIVFIHILIHTCIICLVTLMTMVAMLVLVLGLRKIQIQFIVYHLW